MRVRRCAGAAELTVKSGGGLARVEETLPLEPDRFERLWPLTAGRRIEKRRHEIAGDGGVVIELDVYLGDLAGLRVAEVEFASEADAGAWTAPAWLGPEITDDPRYKNQRLARDGAP